MSHHLSTLEVHSSLPPSSAAGSWWPYSFSQWFWDHLISLTISPLTQLEWLPMCSFYQHSPISCKSTPCATFTISLGVTDQLPREPPAKNNSLTTLRNNRHSRTDIWCSESTSYSSSSWQTDSMSFWLMPWLRTRKLHQENQFWPMTDNCMSLIGSPSTLLVW